MFIKKIFLLMFTLFFILSCENTDNKQTLQEIAITLIANYAEGKGPTPTIRNYEDAGIVGVNEQNIVELNLFIQTLIAEDIDTAEELNAVIDTLGVSLASDIFGPIITIYGANPLTLEKGATYTEPRVTAIDGRDGEVTVYCEGEVDTNTVGTYIVKHSAVDEAGNLSTLDRIVNIVPVTTTPTTPTTPTGYNINFTLEEDDPFLSGLTISIALTNTINNDSITHTWTYPNVAFSDQPPFTQQTFSLPTQLHAGESYHITLTNAETTDTNTSTGPTSPGPGFTPYQCYIPATTITSGTITNSDITLVIACGNLL